MRMVVAAYAGILLLLLAFAAWNANRISTTSAPVEKDIIDAERVNSSIVGEMPISRSHADQAALDFEFEGVVISETLEEVLRTFPDIAFEQEKSELFLRKKVYYRENSKAAESVRYWFHRDRAYRIEIYYGKAEEKGGPEAIGKTMIERFGSDCEMKKRYGAYEMTWRFPEIHRQIGFHFHAPSESVIVSVNDTAVEAELKQRQPADSDLGF